MKNSIFIIFLMVFVSVVAHGQELRFGAKAGLNLASVNIEGESGGRASFHVGGVVDFGITDEFSIMPEVLFSSQGFKADIQATDGQQAIQTVETNWKLNYINIPILGKYEIVEGLSAHLGPQVGLLLSADVEANGQDADVKDSFKGIDFSGAFGAAYELDNGLNFSARYTLGLSNILDDDNAEAKNNVFLLSVGYFFN